MALNIDFKSAANENYTTSKNSPFVLNVRIVDTYDSIHTSYDFLARVMRCRSASTAAGLTVIPFRDLDRDILEVFRDRLIELGGTPPELAPPDNNTPGFVRKDKSIRNGAGS